MSTTTPVAPTEHAATESEHGGGGHKQHGLSDLGYIKVAGLLAVLTAAEVLTYFYDFGVIEVPALLILMVVKFEIVVAYFMHLRFDNKLFTYLFTAGLILTIGVYAAMATSLVFWGDPAGCDAGPYC